MMEEERMSAERELAAVLGVRLVVVVVVVGRNLLETERGVVVLKKASPCRRSVQLQQFRQQHQHRRCFSAQSERLK